MPGSRDFHGPTEVSKSLMDLGQSGPCLMMPHCPVTTFVTLLAPSWCLGYDLVPFWGHQFGGNTHTGWPFYIAGEGTALPSSPPPRAAIRDLESPALLLESQHHRPCCPHPARNPPASSAKLA